MRKKLSLVLAILIIATTMFTTLANACWANPSCSCDCPNSGMRCLGHYKTETGFTHKYGFLWLKTCTYDKDYHYHDIYCPDCGHSWDSTTTFHGHEELGHDCSLPNPYDTCPCAF